jgi:hypothetical protein
MNMYLQSQSSERCLSLTVALASQVRYRSLALFSAYACDVLSGDFEGMLVPVVLSGWGFVPASVVRLFEPGAEPRTRRVDCSRKITFPFSDTTRSPNELGCATFFGSAPLDRETDAGPNSGIGMEESGGLLSDIRDGFANLALASVARSAADNPSIKPRPNASTTTTTVRKTNGTAASLEIGDFEEGAWSRGVKCPGRGQVLLAMPVHLNIETLQLVCQSAPS